jgi:DNA polymerase elongation subunit (family B)
MFWDIEISKAIVMVFPPYYDTFIQHTSVIQEAFIICASWKFSDEPSDKIYTAAIKAKGKDKPVVEALLEAIKSADILVHHNGDKFDLPFLNFRTAYYGLDPISNIKTVDTYKVSKQFKFGYNKLDYLTNLFFNKGKIDVSSGITEEITMGNLKRLDEMIAYNRQDVFILENLYYKLLPYMKSHPHVGAIIGRDRKASCPKCGSNNYKLNGTRFTAAGIQKQECQCKDCKSYFLIPINNG